MDERTTNILKRTLLILLILWGGWSFFSYLGIPVHRESLLLDTADKKGIAASCGAVNDPSKLESPFVVACQGVVAAIPVLSSFITRVMPFLWYIILSVIVIGGYLWW